MAPVPKPVRKSKAERRLEALDRRVNHYGGAEDWQALKLRVFARDRYRCILCGADNPKTGVALEAAHLEGTGMGGRVSCDENRIVTLCHACHSQVDQGTHRAEYRERIEAYLARHGGAPSREAD